MRALKALASALAAILRREVWWAEFWSAATALIWGTLSYWSVQELAVWPSMRVLLEIGGDRFWNTVSLGLGAAQVVFLLLNQRVLRWLAALVMCWFWGVMSLGVWYATPWAPAVAVYAGWCGINVFSILRLLRPLP